MDWRVAVAVAGIVTTVLLALVGAIWWLLNWKIDRGDQYNSDKIDRVERSVSEKIDKVELNLKTEARRIADNVHDMRGEMSVWRLNLESALAKIMQKLGISK